MVPPTIPEEAVARWGLRPDGPPWSGWTADVWPVRGPQAQCCVLKVMRSGTDAVPEAAALRAWGTASAARDHVVRLVDADGGALLLERLDGTRSLAEHPDIDEADRILGGFIADLGGVPTPPQVPSLCGDLTHLREAIGRGRAAAPAALPADISDRALARLSDLDAHVATVTPCLVHYDLHYLNVLPDRTSDRWRVIDPLPRSGISEVEVVATLRNRWADAAATGDPDRALRRRLDVLAEPAGLDRDVARSFAHVVAVDNLVWLRTHDPTHMFVAPYTVLSRW